jgi:hypothetical protein
VLEPRPTQTERCSSSASVSLVKDTISPGPDVFILAAPGDGRLALGSSPAPAQTPVGDSAVGRIVELGEPPARIAGAEIDVHSGPSGESPTGTASWGAGGAGDFSTASVITCLAVTDRTAVVGFSGTNTFFSSEIPIAGLLRVVDGGGPNSSQDTFEWADIHGARADRPYPDRPTAPRIRRASHSFLDRPS